MCACGMSVIGNRVCNRNYMPIKGADCVKDADRQRDTQTVSMFFSAVHHFARIWQNRGMITSTGNPVQHGNLLKALLEVITLPKQLALCKCAAHQKMTLTSLKEITLQITQQKRLHSKKTNVLTLTSCSLIPIEVLKD